VISTDPPRGTDVPKPIRVHALGLGAELAGRVDQILAGTTDGQTADEAPRVRFAPRPHAADVVLIVEPEHGSAAQELAAPRPGARVIVIVEEGSPVVVRRLLEAGAWGVIDAGELTETLVPAIASVAAGLISVCGSAREAALVPALSIRERQVLALMAGGLSNAEIGERLYLTESTIKSHAASAFRRLGVHSRREAVALVLGSSEALRRSVLMSHPAEGDERRRGGTP
jgi:DNA-binding NarL/FixJ family response regulator